MAAGTAADGCTFCCHKAGINVWAGWVRRSVGPVRFGLPPPTLLPRPSPFTTHVSHPNNGRAKAMLTWGFPGHVISHRAQLIIMLPISLGGNHVFTLVLSATLDYIHFSAQSLEFCPHYLAALPVLFAFLLVTQAVILFVCVHVCASRQRDICDQRN